MTSQSSEKQNPQYSQPDRLTGLAAYRHKNDKKQESNNSDIFISMSDCSYTMMTALHLHECIAKVVKC